MQLNVIKHGFQLQVSGIVFLSAQVAESLLALHAKSPLDSCTYIGVDSGAEPMQVCFENNPFSIMLFQ